MYSAYNKLSKHGDNMQPWCTPFPIWNQPVVPLPVLTIASWPAYNFLKMKVRWSAICISFRILHSSLWFTQSKSCPSQQSRNRWFSGTLLLFWWSSRCWLYFLPSQGTVKQFIWQKEVAVHLAHACPILEESGHNQVAASSGTRLLASEADLLWH